MRNEIARTTNWEKSSKIVESMAHVNGLDATTARHRYSGANADWFVASCGSAVLATTSVHKSGYLSGITFLRQYKSNEVNAKLIRRRNGSKNTPISGLTGVYSNFCSKLYISGSFIGLLSRFVWPFCFHHENCRRKKSAENKA